MRDDDYPELGTGEVYLAEGRTIIHFGSPAGAAYTERNTDATPSLYRRCIRLAARVLR